MKIGILGGTFNPIHIGHLILAEEARQILKLDKVIFVPCSLPPHKTSQGVISAGHRLRMVGQAIAGNPDFSICDMEIRAGGKSYTVLTLEKIKESNSPQTEIFLIVGSDAVKELPRWRRFNRILELAKIVIAERPGSPVKSSPSWAKIIPIPQANISSSDIRHRIRKGLSIRYLVPEGVEQYISKKRLYLK